MKKICLLVLALLLPMMTGFVFSRYQKNMLIKYSSKDLSEHGLVIITPSDPEFDDLALKLLSEQNLPDFERIKPFSTFVKNNSSKALVAHSIVWEFIGSDGNKVSRKMSYVNSPALTDGILDVETDREFNESIPAGGYKFLTLAPKSNSQGGGGKGETVDKDPVIVTTQETNMAEERNKAIESLYTNLSKNESQVFILLDGAFFDDGSFVGTDTTNFFDVVETHVRAKRDVMSAVAKALDNSSAPDELDRILKSKAETKASEFRDLSNPEEQYKYTVKMFVTYFTRLNEVSGREGLIYQINQFKSRSLPKIRKL